MFADFSEVVQDLVLGLLDALLGYLEVLVGQLHPDEAAASFDRCDARAA